MMQVVWFWRSRWVIKTIPGDKAHPGFFYIRFWRIEVRFGRGRCGKGWGRPLSHWAYYHG